MPKEQIGGTQPPDAKEASENLRETGPRKTVPARGVPERAEQLADARAADEVNNPTLMRPVDETDADTHQSEGVDQDPTGF